MAIFFPGKNFYWLFSSHLVLRNGPKLKNVFQVASICLLQTLHLCGHPLHNAGDLKSKHAGFAAKVQITPPRPLHQKIDGSLRRHYCNLFFHSNPMWTILWELHEVCFDFSVIVETGKQLAKKYTLFSLNKFT